MTLRNAGNAMDSPLAIGFASLTWGMRLSRYVLDVLRDGHFENCKSGKRITIHAAIVEESASRRVESQRFSKPQTQRARPMMAGLTKKTNFPSLYVALERHVEYRKETQIMAKMPTQRQPKSDSGNRNSNHSSYAVEQKRAYEWGFTAAVSANDAGLPPTTDPPTVFDDPRMTAAYRHGLREGAVAVQQLCDCEQDAADAERKVYRNRPERERTYLDQPEHFSIHRNLDAERAYRMLFVKAVHDAHCILTAQHDFNNRLQELSREARNSRFAIKRTTADGFHFLWWPAGHEVRAAQLRGYEQGLCRVAQLARNPEDITQSLDALSGWLREISQWATEAIEMPSGIPFDGIPQSWLPPRLAAC